MDNESLLEFYQYRLYKKMIDMQKLERAAFMEDVFGKRWIEVYERITIIYPSLLYHGCTKEKP